MKSLSLIFYGTDGDAAKAVASSIRADGGSAQLRHTYSWDGVAEPADRVIMQPCVSEHDKARLAAAFGDQVVGNSAGAALPPPPPPPPPADPLDTLPADWRKQDARHIAAAVSGRAVDNQKQAIEVIEAALAARAAK